MDNRYNARYTNPDNRNCPTRRMYPETQSTGGYRDDFRGNWYAGQPSMPDRSGIMDGTRQTRPNAGNPYMDMRREPRTMQNMQPGGRTGQMRQGMPQNPYMMRQQSVGRRPQEPMGQIYNMPQGSQMGPMTGRRQGPGIPGTGGLGQRSGQPQQMRRSYMNPMGGGMQTGGDMTNR